MNTPPTNTAVPHKNGVKNFHLSTGQGCLLLLVLFLGFGGIIFWMSSNNALSIEGSVKGSALSLVPFGCSADRVSDIVTIPLRDEPQKEGFNLENRALILSDDSEEGETSKARPVVGPSISYRNENEQVTALTCEIANNSLTIRSGRRSSQAGRTREDQWNGALEATCNSAPTGEIAVKLEMKNCD